MNTTAKSLQRPLHQEADVNFQIPGGLSASSPATGDLKFERADWTDFRTVEGLQRKAGIAQAKLRRLVMKELADNALDTGAQVRLGELAGGGYFVEDDGGGIDGEPDQIARLFSIARPMVSTKLLRLPTRGALGNGLRVVAGAVLASEGFLIVTTRNRRLELRPERSGSTMVVSATQIDFPVGTRVEIGFGAAIPDDADALYWANMALQMNRGGQSYQGKSSPWWYDAPQFHELLSASGEAPVRELVARLDGCTGAKAGEIVTEARLGRMACNALDREQAATLLEVARDNAREVKPARLGALGPELFPFAYALSSGVASFGAASPQAKIPFLVEAWVAGSDDDMGLVACINRTPVTGDIYATRDKREIEVFGCGIHHTVAEAPKESYFTIVLNVTSPYMPITSDGKEPDLEPFLGAIMNAVAKAVRKARRPDASADGITQKDVVLDNLDEVIAAVSGEEGYRFNARQLFYALRPIVMSEIGKELTIGNFTTIITDYENENNEIPRMYREPRGSITHPHRDETITLGTLMVEEYERPEWTFNKVLYIEKEGAQEALRQNRWAERNDCAVMSSKGFSTRAARDLIDKLVEHDEPVAVFCVHDADAAGTMIYQTLQEETKARGARKIEIINLGLEPWEAVAMGLEVETLEETKRNKPVADYIGRDWDNWLQTHRVELNAMTTPQLIAWLDAKMAEFGGGKLIPPPDVLEQELADRIEDKVRKAITRRILREAKAEDQIAAAVAKIATADGEELASDIEELFEEESDSEWRDAIETVASRVAS